MPSARWGLRAVQKREWLFQAGEMRMRQRIFLWVHMFISVSQRCSKCGSGWFRSIGRVSGTLLVHNVFLKALGKSKSRGVHGCFCCSVAQSSPTLCNPMTMATRLLCPWDSPGKNTGVGCHSLLQGIFLTQGSNLGLLHCRQILYSLSHQGSPFSTLCKTEQPSLFQ